LLSRQPYVGRAYDSGTNSVTELRRLPINDFEKYLIFYRVRPKRIEVVRVLHGARDIDSILAEEE
jgi:toxin ParE1/3/4